MPATTTANPTGPTTSRSLIRPSMPLLIQVPHVSPAPRAGVARRRRLKREFRMAGLALLAALPLASASYYLGATRSGVPARVVAAASEALAATDTPPIVSLRMEPIALPTGPATISATVPTPEDRGLVSPVVLRGVILPDDGSKEAAIHAGS